MEKDHLEILLEDIRGKFDAVLEGHQVLRSDIERVRGESKERDDHFGRSDLSTQHDRHVARGARR